MYKKVVKLQKTDKMTELLKYISHRVTHRLTNSIKSTFLEENYTQQSSVVQFK